jgi:hypothetical protein
MQPFIDLSDGLKMFMIALIDDKTVSSDENLVAKRLQRTGRIVNPKALRTIMDFATNCGYLETVGSQLAFTKTAYDRVRKFKNQPERLIVSNEPKASDSDCNLTGI